MAREIRCSDVVILGVSAAIGYGVSAALTGLGCDETAAKIAAWAVGITACIGMSLGEMDIEREDNRRVAARRGVGVNYLDYGLARR